MQTTIRLGAPPTTPTSTITLYAGDGMHTTGAEIDFRMRRLAAEAQHERSTRSRDGLRRTVGHSLIALGRAIHGLEPDPPARRPALRAR